MKRNIVIILVFAVTSGLSAFAQKPTVDWRNPFVATKMDNAVTTYTNPVIPGFYSDPSVCRVNDDYYLVTSTFEYFPGVPVFHSKDLVNWVQIGYCIDRVEQLPEGMNIYAPTIRYYAGTFYMITTNAYRGGNFIVTAKDPSGPWSDPIWIDIVGIDPDLFFDDDGKVYVVDATMHLYEIDINTGKLLSEGRKIWNGTGGRYAEGPHLYKKDGYYYLMAAEGGTEECHCETIARSVNIWGPYIENPANPILAHATAAGEGKPIQGVGHADLVQAKDNTWWMVFHGYRSVAKEPHHILGRETCLAPVSWPENGWPVVNGNGTVDVDMTCQTLPLSPFPAKAARTDFTEKKLGLEWNYIQLPDYKNYTLNERPGFLRLKGSAEKIGDKRWESPTFVGRRVQNLVFTATTSLEFEPTDDHEEAGLILLNNGSHFDLMVMNIDGKKCLVVKLQFGSVTYKTSPIEVKPGPVSLRVSGQKSIFTFSYSQGGDEFTDIKSVESKFLSSETVGRYTGVYVGLYSTGDGKTSVSNADYDWFEYK